MIKILFICHGNICRSPMGKYVLQDMVNKAGLSHRFEIDSAAVSREEIGNPVYPPARRELAKHGISCEGHAARQVTMKDYHYFDRIQERIIRFVEKNSHVKAERFREMMLKSGDMSNDVGSVVYGEEAVALGLMDQVGTLHDALEALYGMMKKQRKQEKEDA